MPDEREVPCCDPEWSNGSNAIVHGPENVHKTVEQRTKLGSNLRSLAEVELVEEEIQDPRDCAGYSKDAVGGAGVKCLHHVPTDKAACSFACNQCTQGYRCYKINIFSNKGNHKSDASSCPPAATRNGIIMPSPSIAAK